MNGAPRDSYTTKGLIEVLLFNPDGLEDGNNLRAFDSLLQFLVQARVSLNDDETDKPLRLLTMSAACSLMTDVLGDKGLELLGVDTPLNPEVITATAKVGLSVLVPAYSNQARNEVEAAVQKYAGGQSPELQGFLTEKVSAALPEDKGE